MSTTTPELSRSIRFVILLLSVTSDVSILAFLGVAFSYKRALFAPINTQLILILVFGSLVGALGMLHGNRENNPYTWFCRSTIGLTIQSGVNLSYISSCAICTAIFRTLVLRRPQPEGWVKWLLIGFPIVDSIFMGALTIGQIGATPSGNCWFADATGPIATFTGLKVLIMVLYNLILVAILSIKLSRETAETSKMLSGKGNADQVKSTVDRVSNRMILYPIICLICGGSAVLVQVIFYDNNDAIIFGDQMVAAEGFLNFFAFYVLDPMAHNMATKLVVDLKKNTSRMAPYAKIFCDVVVKLNVASWNTKPKDPVPGSTASSTASGTHSSAQSNAGRKTSTVPLVAHAERPISMGSTSTERSASVAGTTPAVEKTGVADEHNVPTIQEEEAAKDHPRQEATL